MQLLKLKSGSDIRGIAYDIGTGAIELTNDAVSRIVEAFYRLMQQRCQKQSCVVAVGHDSRLSAPRLATCICDTLVSLGCQVLFTGLSATPAMFMITTKAKYAVDASIAITASHHPKDKNGLKFFTKDGGLEESDIVDILTVAQTLVHRASDIEGSVQTCPFMREYASDLVDLVRTKTHRQKPLGGMHIVVDAGNGAGGFYVTDVLIPLGADCCGSQFLQADGNFPNHTPNPEDAVAMKSICNQVLSCKADFGIIFDTDVDRAGAVDHLGQPINRNRLIALISAILLKERKGGTIVTDSVTSDGLQQFIEQCGGVHHRYKRGYKNVINECIRLNAQGIDSPLAIETSGHAALKENYYLDDGAYLITRLLIALSACKNNGKHLISLVDGLKMPCETAEVRLTFLTDDILNYQKQVLNGLHEQMKSDTYLRLKQPNFEGIRCSSDIGWFLLRMSVHDPLMVINFESDHAGGCLTLAKKLLELLQPYDQLDKKPLEQLTAHKEDYK